MQQANGNANVWYGTYSGNAHITDNAVRPRAYEKEVMC